MLRLRVTVLFQCVLLFFMNSQFVFSATEASAKSHNEICDSKSCVLGDTAHESRVEKMLTEAILEKNSQKVAYYFLESREQFIKHSAWMTYHVLFAAAMYSAGFYCLFSASLYGLSEANNAGMISCLMFLGPIGLVSIGSTAYPLNLSRKTKKRAEEFLVEKLGVETFRRIKNLKFTSAGVLGLINVVLELKGRSLS